MIGVAHVLPHGLRVMALQRRGEELIRRGVGNPQPEPLGRFQIGVLMDEDTEGQVGPGSPGRVEEPQEELDQRRVAVREDDAVAAPVRLVLGAFAPVGDGAGDMVSRWLGRLGRP